MIDRVQRVVDEHRLLDKRTKILIGVSGGADSIFLLHVMQRICAARGITCVVGHVNHGLRAEEADADAAFVEQTAESLGLDSLIVHKATAERAAGYGESVEMAARADRHEAFRLMIQESRADALVLAHHQGDQAETVLLKLCRSQSPDGFAGMPFERAIQGMTILRPLLNIAREDIRSWLVEQGMAWREDASNQEDRFLRNRVRSEVLPLLGSRINPGATEHIAASAQQLQELLAFVDEQAESHWASLVNDHGELAVEAFKLTDVLANRLLVKWLVRSGFPPECVTLRLIGQIRELCTSSKGSVGLDPGAGFRVERAYQQLRLSLEADEIDLPEIDLPVSSTQSLTDWGISVRIEAGTGYQYTPEPGPGVYPTSISISASRLGGRTISLRSWQPGDRLVPFGMQGSRKLQDIFTDYKVPLHRRGTIPVLTVGGEVIYLQGYRIANDWRVEGCDAPSICVTFANL